MTEDNIVITNYNSIVGELLLCEFVSGCGLMKNFIALDFMQKLAAETLMT